MPRPTATCTQSFVIGLYILIVGSSAYATNIRWTAGNGNFHIGGNWQGEVAPGVLDVAQFGRSAAPFQLNYTVSFVVDATNQALHVEDDVVTFDLNGRLYSVTTASGVVIGNQPGGLSGSLTVIDGTISGTTNIDVGAAASTSGTLTVGAGGLISSSPNLNIGKLGAGTLTVQTDGDISTTGATTIGVGTGVTGTATIIGNGTAGSATLVTGTLNVGNTGNGTVNVQVGGLLQNNADAVVGAGSLFTGVGTGVVNVSGNGSLWKSLGLLEVGAGGSGEVNITNGGKVMAADSVVAASLNSLGEVNVIGPSSSWDNSGTLTVGALGSGTLNITNQGVVENSAGFIGNAALGPVLGAGTVNVDGAGSQWNIAKNLIVGGAGTGTLNMTDGGRVRNDIGRLGLDSTSEGTATVDGNGSRWENSSLVVGNSGVGTLSITGGGVVQTAFDGLVGFFPGSTGTATVDGDGSRLESPSLVVGYFGEGTLNITNGGHVQSSEATLSEAGGTGHVVVDGDGSLWDIAQKLLVGNEGDGTLEITGGGQVVTSGLIVPPQIGSGPTGTGRVLVDGDGSRWDISSQLFVGLEGQGTLALSSGGIVNVPELILVSELGFISLEGGALSTSQIVFIDGGNADSNFEWTSGTLRVESFQGNLVNQAGVLAPGNPVGSTQISGDYTQLAEATLDIEIGGVQDNQHDAAYTTGSAFLGGDLKLSLVNGFVPNPADTILVLGAAFSVFNEFANVSNGQRLSTADGLGSFVVNYGAGSPFDPESVVLSNFLTGPVFAEADFDEDGDVDGDDLARWRTGFGLSGSATHMQGNADADADVDGADFLVWQRQLGSGIPSMSMTVAVPEPATSLLLVSGTLALLFRRRVAVS